MPDRPAVEAVDAAVGDVLVAMEPWRAPRDYLNLRESADEPGRFFPPDTLQRLREVKRRYDPASVFRSNHPVSDGHCARRRRPPNDP